MGRPGGLLGLMFGDGFALGAFLFGGKVSRGTSLGPGLLLAFCFLVVVMPFFGIDAFLFAGLGRGGVAAGGGGLAVVVGPVACVDSFFGNLVAGFRESLALKFGQGGAALGLVGFEHAADLALAGFGLGWGREGAVASSAFGVLANLFDSLGPFFTGEAGGPGGLLLAHLFGEGFWFGNAAGSDGLGPLFAVELFGHGKGRVVISVSGKGGVRARRNRRERVFLGPPVGSLSPTHSAETL